MRNGRGASSNVAERSGVSEENESPKTPGSGGGSEWLEGWSARRAKESRNEKELMARHYARHDFLTKTDASPEDPSSRENVAEIFANQGTTPNEVVKGALQWIEKHAEEGPLTVTWYTPGALIPATLRDFRERYKTWRSVTRLCLFPGIVDPDLESVMGPEPIAFASELRRRQSFTLSLLSAHSIDIETGAVKFNYNTEVELQRECALIFAAHKFLFMDSTKFRRVGSTGYGIFDLLDTSEAVTIYTVASKRTDVVKVKFETLSQGLLENARRLSGRSLADDRGETADEAKTLALQVVGKDGGDATECFAFRGVLRKPEKLRPGICAWSEGRAATGGAAH